MKEEGITSILQQNKQGKNIGGDYVGGDKIANALIGKIVGNITNLSITAKPNYELTEQDLEKYKEIIPGDQFPIFKNLIERIEFHIELQEYDTAKRFIEEANAIYLHISDGLTPRIRHFDPSVENYDISMVLR